VKTLDELRRCVDIKELRFYLDYNIMIAEMMVKRGLDTSNLHEETTVIKQRIAQLTKEE
jgi:hypothetical protein